MDPIHYKLVTAKRVLKKPEKNNLSKIETAAMEKKYLEINKLVKELIPELTEK